MITLCIVAYVVLSLGFTIADHGSHWNSFTGKYEYTSWKSAFKFGFLLIPGIIIAGGLFIGALYSALFIVVKILEVCGWIYHHMP